MRYFPGTSRLWILTISTLLAGIAIFSFPAYAQGNSSIAVQFQTNDSGITAASLVSIEQDNPNSIVLGDASHSDRVVGIVSDKPLIELSDGGSGVQVVTNGLTKALVSDINGPISTGDKVTASPIKGVGMKATENVTVVGTAQGNLQSSLSDTRTVTDKTGKKVTVNIGLIPVQVGVAFYDAPSNKKATYIPTFFQEVANNIAGGTVSPIRVVIAALILLLLFLSVTILLYSSVRSSIISIGRNPLSEAAVHKSLFEVGLTIFILLVFTVLLIYMVLKI